MRSWNRLSLATKLPLALALLLASASGVLIAATYGHLRTSSVDLAGQRLSHAATQMAELFETSVRQRLRLMETFVDRADAAAHLSAPTDASRAAIRAAMTAYAGAPSATGAVELWAPDGRTLESVGVTLSPMTDTARRETMRAALASPKGAVAPFTREGDRLVYVVSWAVQDGGHVAGYAVERRPLTQSNQATTTLLTNLIGEGARLLLGNAVGEEWMDLAGVIAPPAVSSRAAPVWQYVGRSGEPAVASAVPVDGTPWLVAIEFPAVTVLEPAQRFLRTGLGTMAALTTVGALFGWVLCRRVTTPLGQVTDAAEAIAASQVAPKVHTTREDEVGRLARSFNVMADEVTEGRQRLEALVGELETRVLERTAALEHSNRELESFSYSVSHDLRAPLRAIDGFARILVEDHAKELSSEARQSLEVIVHRTRHMGELIDDLLTFSRLGRQPLARGPVDMTAMARAAVDDAVRAQAERRFEIDVQPLPPADGERGLVRQVFENLVQNAVKFTARRDPAIIDVGHEAKDGETVYYVRDNGVGFDMQYADKLFGVFQRLHRAEDFEGTGVGLAIVDRIVRRHGGRVWAESRVDHGTTFFFTIPPERKPA